VRCPVPRGKFNLTQRVATGIAEITGAIYALALGRVVDVPLTIYPANTEDGELALARRDDSSILGLARDSVSLDVIWASPAKPDNRHAASWLIQNSSNSIGDM